MNTISPKPCNENEDIDWLQVSVRRLPLLGETRDLFDKALSETPTRRIEVRHTKYGMYLATKSRGNKLTQITPYFPYVSPIFFEEGKSYFYAGDADRNSLYLYTITTHEFGIETKKLLEESFSQKEILQERHIGSGIIEYTVPDDSSTEMTYKTRFIDILSSQSYNLEQFSFDAWAISGKTVFRENNMTYIIGRVSENEKCVIVLSWENWEWHVLWDTFLGNITPVIGTDKRILGFEWPIQKNNGDIGNYQILFGEKKWSRQEKTLHIVK